MPPQRSAAGVDLIVLERRVGAGEVDLLGDELLDARAGAGRVVRRFLPGQTWPHTLLNTAMAFCWAVEPSAVSEFLPPQSAPTPTDEPGPRRAVPVVPALLSLPHAVSVSAATAVAETVVTETPCQCG